MKKMIMMSVLLLSTSLLVAQTANKPATVRIKKIENINGVEKITDTTFTTNDPPSLQIDNGTIDIIGLEDGQERKMIKTIIIDDGNGEHSNVEIKGLDKEISAEIEKAMKEAGLDGTAKGTKKIVIINDEDEKVSGDKKTRATKTIVINRIDITNADETDMKRISKSAGETDGKLNIEKMNFYPNPNTGKFNLSFNLPEKGDTEINIMNIDGKIVYKEKLAGFSGNYDKEIDISKNAKGIYFVKVEQGKHAQVRKIILE
ncbi:MAG: T9SS type A sorting domain-containing protein [Bacteroidota bacterium]